MDIQDKKFEMLGDLKLPNVLCDASLRNCWFMACNYGMTAGSPGARRVIRNVKLTHCKVTNNSTLGPVVLENVDVDGLSTGGLCMVRGAALRHVRIRGRCGRFMFAPLPSMADPARSAAFDAANAMFYRDVDWALDIADAEFEECDMRNVPAHLVRRDPVTQVVVRRERVREMQHVWNALDLSGTSLQIALSNMLSLDIEDRVLVAPRRKDCSMWIAAMRRLQDAGVAEPD